MTFLVERLRDIERYIDHLEMLRPRVRTPDDLADDFSLHNDVLYSLLQVAQMVVDVAGELSARHDKGFANYTEAVLNLRLIDYPSELVTVLSKLPGFRNIVVHEYARLNYERVLEALDELDVVRSFAELVRERELPD